MNRSIWIPISPVTWIHSTHFTPPQLEYAGTVHEMDIIKKKNLKSKMNA